MIVILKNHPDEAQLENLITWLTDQDIHIHPTVGASQTILGLVGDTSKIDMDLYSGSGYCRRREARVQEPYKMPTGNFIR